MARRSMPTLQQKQSHTPFYKLWWFWLIIGLVVILIILPILIFFIGFIAYFGVFTPGIKVSSFTTIQPPFQIVDGNSPISALTGVTLEILNVGVREVTLQEMTISNCGGSNIETVTLAPEASQQITIPCTTPLKAGDSFLEDITVDYTSGGSNSIPLTATGTIFGTVGP